MMSQQPCGRIFVSDGRRLLCWQACDEWDRTTMLACLSSDPRSLDELALAWSRCRPKQPLLELGWSEGGQAPPSGRWLAIDLARQHYAIHGPEELAPEPGCYEPDEVGDEDRNALAWINTPPWWQQVASEPWPFALALPSDGDAQRAQGEPAPLVAPAAHAALDFRSVLYGRPLLNYIAEQAIGCGTKGRASHAGGVQLDDAEPVDAAAEADQRARSRDGLTAAERAQLRRWEEVTKRIHGRWLMTPRNELGWKCPREYLHRDRAWKDRELDHRRSQWSRERRPPTPVPRTSALFRYGPMGSEEVISYFDLCRQLINAALQWIDDEPRLDAAEVIQRLEQLREGWLASEADDGDGESAQEVIDGERQLVPRVASSDPIDCDCPLCRIHQLEPAMFGPAFLMRDPYREDMEEEFVFSLHARRRDWEDAREEWLSWSGAAGEASDVADEGDDEEPDDDEPAGDEPIASTQAAGGDWADVWQSSYSDMSHGKPGLSLLGIGGHLGEIISDLKRIDAAREEIDQLNRAFDELARSMRYWLTREATSQNGASAECPEPAGSEMLRLLEVMALKHPELTAKSADLQSQIHQWQRQLSPSSRG